MNDRLYRSPTDRVIAGVAGGMAVWLNVDPSLVRIGWVLLAVLSGGIFVLVYIVMMIIVPLPPPGWAPHRPMAAAGGWAGWAGAGPDATGTSEPASTGGPPPSDDWGSPPPAPGAPAEGWTSQPPTAGGWTSPSPTTTGWDGRNSGRGAGVLLGVVLIVLGVWFLVGRYVHVDWSTIWPLALVALGVGLLIAAIRRAPAGGDR